MNRALHWDDLRVVLAIAEAGSLAGAGRRLERSHATVFRRVGEIERRLGVRLFERARSGYTTTVAGDEIVAAAGRVEAEVQELERSIAGQDLRPSGTVRVTTTDTLLARVLSPMLVDFLGAYPDIALEIVVPSEVFNLSKREADVAIRPARDPPESLVGRRVGTIEQAIYVPRDWLGAGDPDLHAVDWIGPDDTMGYRLLDRWMVARGYDARCRLRVDTLAGALAAARDGGGATALPCYLGDSDPGLGRVGAPLPALATDLWLLTHPDLRRSARIRAVLDFVEPRLRAWCSDRQRGHAAGAS